MDKLNRFSFQRAMKATALSNVNVLMIGPSLQSRGGMATVERQLLEHLPKAGIDVRFLPTYTDSGKVRKLAIAMNSYVKFCRLLDGFEIVHIHTASRNSFSRKSRFVRFAKKRGKKVVLHLHGSEFGVWFIDECTTAQREKIRSVLDGCTKVVVLSEEWREFFLENKVCNGNKIAVLHNAVNVPAENVTNYTSNNVLFMGCLDDRKSPDVLLRAAARILPNHPDASFTFGGDGDVQTYRDLAIELGIAQRCVFTGWVNSLERDRLYRESSIYCLPSKNEGMPMSVLEAMSYGLATLSTSVGGVPQVITNDKDGFIFPVGDDRVLAEILGNLMSDEKLKGRIGNAGRNRIVQAFGMNALIEQISDLYKEIAL